jgi:hypothetical protein
MFAAINQVDMEFVRALVNPGAAYLDYADKAGKTALDFANEAGYAEMATYMASKESEADYKSAEALKTKNREQPSCPKK